MMAKPDVTRVVETIMSTPGMNEPVKLALKMSRKNVLLLSQVIERGLAKNKDGEKGFSMLENIPEESTSELQMIGADLLQKAGLTEMNEKLKTLC